MQAIILAAGMGKRLKELTKHNTKCMVEVNGETLISRMLHQIERLNLSRIVIVVGYEGRKLMDYINTLDITTEIIYIENPIYDKTNNIYSLSLAKDWLLSEDTLLFESDLIFEDEVINALVNDKRESLVLVDKFESWMSGTCVTLNENDEIDEFVPGNRFDFNKKNEYFKTVNVYKFSSRFSKTTYVPFLDAYQVAVGQNEYYEQVLRVITMLDKAAIQAKRLDGQKWYEIDDVQDLDIASSIFMTDYEEKAKQLTKRYGGYWRYPKLIDFCYLVNPFFPPQKMIDEMKMDFAELMMQYPSGMRVNSLLASKNFGVRVENILVGNGAAELIKALMENLSGKTGIIRPSFEEYAHRIKSEDLVCFIPDNENFSYTARDVIDFFDDKKIENLVIVNPDNPSGNLIDRSGILELLNWSDSENIKIIIDESFIDFSDEENATLISQDILDKYENLYVIKSISKSYGVPGLRLGILASGDVTTVSKLKKDAAIWNINSFAEIFMQIFSKYEKDYRFSLKEFQNERRRFTSKLSQIKEIRVIPSQANFIMMEIDSRYPVKKLQADCLEQYNLLIKELSEKITFENNNYVRVAVKSPEENDRLISALTRLLRVAGVTDGSR